MAHYGYRHCSSRLPHLRAAPASLVTPRTQRQAGAQIWGRPQGRGIAAAARVGAAKHCKPGKAQAPEWPEEKQFKAGETKPVQIEKIDINANHIRPAFDGYVYATAKAESLGRTTQVWTIRIEDEAGKLVCISRFTVAVIPLERK